MVTKLVKEVSQHKTKQLMNLTHCHEHDHRKWPHTRLGNLVGNTLVFQCRMSFARDCHTPSQGTDTTHNTHARDTRALIIHAHLGVAWMNDRSDAHGNDEGRHDEGGGLHPGDGDCRTWCVVVAVTCLCPVTIVVRTRR